MAMKMFSYLQLFCAAGMLLVASAGSTFASEILAYDAECRVSGADMNPPMLHDLGDGHESSCLNYGVGEVSQNKYCPPRCQLAEALVL